MNSVTLAQTKRTLLGNILLSGHAITEEQLGQALAHQAQHRCKLGRALVSLGFVSETDIARALRRQGRMPCIDLRPGMVEREVAARLGEELSVAHEAIALNCIAGITTVAMEDPLDLDAVDAFAQHLATPVLAVYAEPSKIRSCLETVFGIRLRPTAEVEELAGTSASKPSDDPERPITNLIRGLFQEALDVGASDVHFEPRENALSVRFRVDGSLYERLSLARGWMQPVVARLKSLAGLDIARTNLPQVGFARHPRTDREVELRLATAPTLLGEEISVRILDRGRPAPRLDDLGLDEDDHRHLRAIVESREGLILASGPSGSGRTTTLYSLLRELNSPDRKIVAIEDPVALHLEGVTQIDAGERQGWSIAEGLRAVLEQDPDVVLVGDLRDAETATLATRAARTGKLVFSSVHAVGAVETLAVLEEMRVDSRVLADTLRGIVCQRLVRRICPSCRREVHAQTDAAQRLGLRPEDVRVFAGAGCPSCHGTGYRGRFGLFEILDATPEVTALVRGKERLEDIAYAARRGGLRTLREKGIQRALRGETTLEEIVAATSRKG